MKTAMLGAGIILLMLAAAVPAVIADLNREAEAAQMAPSASRAQAVAVLAVESGARRLASDPPAWPALQSGSPPAGYDLDAAFSDEPGTRYAVRLSSGPGAGEVTITGVGQDLRRGEIRAVRAVYRLAPASAWQPVSCSWGADPRPSCD